ncbi:hypothetical protein ACFYST_01020 [Kitasatospora sp. NPDC004614]|uniref:hypothetical protein n=1 Tax=unclassified Kitasatospora TaxID=2633591 RepID=UPI0036A5933D
MLDFCLTLADREFYVPMERAPEVGERYRPSEVPDGRRGELFPLAQPLERDPRGRAELYLRDLEQEVPVPEALWRTATRYHGAATPETPSNYDLPTAAELDEKPEQALTALRNSIAAGLLGMARPDGQGCTDAPSRPGSSTPRAACADRAARERRSGRPNVKLLRLLRELTGTPPDQGQARQLGGPVPVSRGNHRSSLNLRTQ